MILSSSELDVPERARFRTVAAFLKDRLAEPETVDWALRLRPDRQVERAAIFELLTGSGAPRLREPYATAWPLILESWSYCETGHSPESALLQIRKRLQGGDRSGSLVEEIANLSSPRLEVKPLEARPRLPARKPRRPKNFRDLLSASLTNASPFLDIWGDRIDIGLNEITDAAFLHAVASALMSAVDRGLYIAHRIYGSNKRDWPLMASPLRVYFVPPDIGDSDAPGGRLLEPDALTRGVAPAVKLLHAVLEHVAEFDTDAAGSILGRCRYSGIPIYRRLWAAAARNTEAVSAAEVGEFLTSLDDGDFWDFCSFPEFAELRARRFKDFEPETQALIVKRLRGGLPCKAFPRKMEAVKVRTARRRFTAMELRRIEIGGGILPAQDRDWLLEASDEFPGLKKMAVDGGFRDPWILVPPYFPSSTTPKTRFDVLEGEARLQALEDALSGGTSDDQATEWLRHSDHALHILRDLEGAASLVNCFPHLWDRFGHMHSQPERETPRDAQSEAARVLGLMNWLSDATIEAAIDGISRWLHMWSEHVITSELGQRVWLRAWPSAVKVTNVTDTGDVRSSSYPTIRTGGEDRAPEETNAFHLPVGKLLRVFLELFLFTEQIRDPFADGSLLAQMRDGALAAQGRSGLIAHCHLTQKVPDFLQVDPTWAMRRLVDPLLNDGDISVPLWRAIASTWIDSDILKIIGDEVPKRVLDDRLGKDTRKDLVSCLVNEGLTAFKDCREPSVSWARISQTLRAADDEIRKYAASTIWYFQDYEYKVGQVSHSPRTSFLSAVKPFLERVWPQERSLATAGVSHQLSCLPAVSGEAFPEAVDVIERFLVPFDSCSMLSYGFCEGDMSKVFGMPRLSDAVDDEPKARALLRLLDLTVGASQNAVIPEDLGTALGQIQSEAPSLTSDSAFRRLAAAARR